MSSLIWIQTVWHSVDINSWKNFSKKKVYSEKKTADDKKNIENYPAGKELTL